MCLGIIARREKSKLNLRRDEGGMANPLAGEQWRSRHDGVRQRPSLKFPWHRGDLISVVRSCRTKSQGKDAARPSRADALGRDPRAAFDLWTRRSADALFPPEPERRVRDIDMSRSDRLPDFDPQTRPLLPSRRKKNVIGSPQADQTRSGLHFRTTWSERGT